MKTIEELTDAIMKRLNQTEGLYVTNQESVRKQTLGIVTKAKATNDPKFTDQFIIDGIVRQYIIRLKNR